MKRGFLLATTLMLVFSVKSDAQKWKMQQAVLKSRWARKVSPNTSLNTYPRPALVRSQWKSLNGLWDYAIASKEQDKVNEYDGKILVPYPIESALSGVQKNLLPDQHLWYRKEFNLPLVKPGERILLHFGAVDWQATVFVNGKEVGQHTGGYTAFTFDITDAMREGRNEIVVKVFDPTDQGINPHGKQTLQPESIYYTASSGIWQTVWLETVPLTHIEELVLTPNIDQQRLSVNLIVNGDTSGVMAEITASKSGVVVAKLTGSLSTIFSLKINNTRLWSPEDPFLYDLQIRLVKNKYAIDQVKSYFGMRKIEIKKDTQGYERIFLNNKCYYNLGVLDQGFWPEGLYTAPTDEALAFDIKAIKQMGFNTIRKHIKVEPARWYYHADKIGVLVWQDFVNPPHNLPEGAKQQFEKEAKEMLDQLRNYPSITTWVLFNERWGAYDQQRLTEWVKSVDPTRLVNGHSGELLYVNEQLRAPSENPYVGSDMSDVHSYPNPRLPPKQIGKAMIIGEFGGVGVSVPYHQWNDMQGWGYVQAKPGELQEKYAGMIKSLKGMKEQGLCGSIYTQPFDVEGEENGLITYDREIIKIPLHVMRELNSSLYADMPVIDASTYIAKNIDVNDTDDRYAEFLAMYENGKTDSAFLRRLILMAIRKQDQSNATKVQATYVLRLKSIYTKANLEFLRSIMRTSNDTSFLIFLRNAETINSISGNHFAERWAMGVIEREDIAIYTTDKHTKPDWVSIEKKVVDKYGEIGAEAVYGRRMVYEQTQKNWKDFGVYYKLYYDRAIGRSRYHVNNISWDVFLHVNDTAILNLAIKAMKYDLEYYGDHPSSIDTYANLLYKIGRTTEAIEWEEKGVKLSNNRKDLVETLEKMRKRIPTWQ